MTILTLNDQLEALVDRHTLKSVLLALSCVCSEKAEHVSYAWQDNVTAKPWRNASNALDLYAQRVEV